MIGSSQRVCHVCKYTTRIFGVVQTTPHTHTGHTQTSRGIIEFDRMPKMQITTLHIMGLIQFSGTHEHTRTHCETSALCNVCTCPSTYTHTDADTDNNCTQFASVFTPQTRRHTDSCLSEFDQNTHYPAAAAAKNFHATSRRKSDAAKCPSPHVCAYMFVIPL